MTKRSCRNTSSRRSRRTLKVTQKDKYHVNGDAWFWVVCCPGGSGLRGRGQLETRRGVVPSLLMRWLLLCAVRPGAGPTATRRSLLMCTSGIGRFLRVWRRAGAACHPVPTLPHPAPLHLFWLHSTEPQSLTSVTTSALVTLTLAP